MIQFYIVTRDPMFKRNLNFVSEITFRSDLWVLNIIIKDIQLFLILTVLIASGYAQIWLLKSDDDVTTKWKQVAVKKNKTIRLKKKILAYRKCFWNTITGYINKLHVQLNVFLTCQTNQKEHLIATLSSVK